ncbi:Molybdopterin synthase sulfur carrier subunit [hydrothermal vent metagenome]|uniref:Molybdopterin synthase sulfur carrier subunit n=1 Tax=hydrothermal vent metagenome TaxID=652676 RepID=A0A3B1B2D7_9ZZZZ
MINILYFASLREQLQSDSEQLEMTSGITDINSLIEVLRARGGIWEEAFNGSTVMLAVNQEVAKPTKILNDGDEVAFFPPVTGG